MRAYEQSDGFTGWWQDFGGSGLPFPTPVAAPAGPLPVDAWPAYTRRIVLAAQTARRSWWLSTGTDGKGRQVHDLRTHVGDRVHRHMWTNGHSSARHDRMKVSPTDTVKELKAAALEVTA